MSKRFVHGSWLWLTCEFDSGRFSLEQSWLEIRKQFNRHRSWILKRFGRVKCWTFLQAHVSGYAHLHVIVEFLEHVFSGFCHVGRGGKVSFRCDDKQLFSDNWNVGFVEKQVEDWW